MKELDASYNPARDLINQQLTALPAQSDAQIAGLKATQDQAFNDITSGARDRGIGFSGIPLGEQAKYTASTFLPAVANVQATQNTNKNTLLSALNSIGMDQQKTALGLQQQQVQNDLAQRAADAQARAAAASNAALGSLFSSQPPASSAPSLPAGMGFKNGSTGAKGFNFNWGSKPVSAATYAKVNNISIGDLLYSMAQSGDSTAAAAYKDIVNNKGNITPNLMNRYSSIFWGELPAATKAPAAKAAASRPVATVKNAYTPVNLFNNPLALKR